VKAEVLFFVPTSWSPRSWILPWVAAASIGSASCQALPPPARADARAGVVRAGSPEEALEVASALDELLPEVITALPDSRPRELEVWVQREPALYRFPPSSAYREADGFFSDRLARIHLREGADDVRRTLAHELVHACLGKSWRALPGTIEEGLCDVFASRLCPAAAPRLRAGRLLAAGLALGGFDLECPAAESRGELHFVQHVFSPERRTDPLDPLDVFRSHAGRSTAAMPSDTKKALYGLAFVVAERIADRRGFEGFHALVESSTRKTDAEEVFETYLDAAGLTRNPEDWRRAVSEAVGPIEAAEMARLIPGIAPAGATGLHGADPRP
jgi:hypothetical protein